MTGVTQSITNVMCASSTYGTGRVYVIAGHSQGGGHTFYIAKKVVVDKTIFFHQ